MPRKKLGNIQVDLIGKAKNVIFLVEHTSYFYPAFFKFTLQLIFYQNKFSMSFLFVDICKTKRPEFLSGRMHSGLSSET